MSESSVARKLAPGVVERHGFEVASAWQRNSPLSIFPISLILLHVLAISNCPRLQSQDVVLFNDTIMHNVRYGRLSATDEEVTPRSREQLPCPS